MDKEAAMGAVESPPLVTQLLHAWQQGDLQARDQAVEAMYAELLALARSRYGRHGGGTMQPGQASVTMTEHSVRNSRSKQVSRPH